MGKSKSSLSKAHSYAELGEFWDTHDLTEYWDQTKPAEFEVDIRSEVTYYALDSTLSAEVRALAERRGVTPETLLNLWVQEKLHQSETQQQTGRRRTSPYRIRETAAVASSLRGVATTQDYLSE